MCHFPSHILMFQNTFLAKNSFPQFLRMFFPYPSVPLVYYCDFLVIPDLVILLVLLISTDCYLGLDLILTGLVWKNMAGHLLFTSLGYPIVFFLFAAFCVCTICLWLCLASIFRFFPLSITYLLLHLIFRLFLIKRQVHNLKSLFCIWFRNHIPSVLVPILPVVQLDF